MPESLILLPRETYPKLGDSDPLRFYYLPVVGRLYRERVERTLQELPGGKRVLEIGFGSGVALVNLSKKYQRVDGLDLDSEVAPLEKVFRGQGYPVHLRNGSVLKMPYPANSFDAVMLVSILEHLKPQELSAAVKEVARVLKPGGRMVYGVPVERPLMVFLFRVLGYDIRTLHFSTEKDVAAAAGKHLAALAIKPMTFLGLHIYEVGSFMKEAKRGRSKRPVR
jgi:ubiquinone/menaquinone biosynthesis C-methylase UbiE